MAIVALSLLELALLTRSGCDPLRFGAGMGGEPRQPGDVALAILASLPDMSVLAFDVDLRYVFAVGEALAAHGYSAESMTGSTLAEVVPRSVAERLSPAYEAALRGERTRFELTTEAPERVYDVEIGPLERAGVVVGGIAVSRDVTQRKRTERALVRSERAYRDLAEQASDVVSRTNREAVYTYVSPSCERIYGRSPAELVGRSVFDFLHAEDVTTYERIRAALEAGGQEEVAERRFRRPDGSWVWVESRFRAIRDDDGEFAGVQTSARDITDRKLAEQAQRVADAQFRTAFDDALVGLALVAPDGTWLPVNDALCSIVGYSREELTSMTFQDITHPDDLDADLSLLEEVLAGDRVGYQMEKRYLRPVGGTVWALLSVSLVRADDGNPLHFISQVQDISERTRLEDELRRLATRDDLTGLYNRRHFEHALEQQLRRVRRYEEPASVLFIDLDGFKHINDSLGHHAGDELIRQVGAILRARLRDSDVLARLGGDEFAVLLPLTTLVGADSLVASLEAELERRPVTVGEAEVRAQASIGVAALEGDLDVDGALRLADEAMYRVKHARRDM